MSVLPDPTDKSDVAYSIYRRPFHVPHRYKVIHGVGFTAYGDLIRVNQVAADSESANRKKMNSAGNDPQNHPHEQSASSAANPLVIRRLPAFSRSCNGALVGGALSSQKVPVAHRERFWLLLRSLKLHTMIPALVPGILPMVDVYRANYHQQQVFYSSRQGGRSSFAHRELMNNSNSYAARNNGSTTSPIAVLSPMMDVTQTASMVMMNSNDLTSNDNNASRHRSDATAGAFTSALAAQLSPSAVDQAGHQHDVYCVFPSMECTLADALATTEICLTERQILAILRELLMALKVLHANNIVVCNLRPENVMLDTKLDSRQCVRLTDITQCVLAGIEQVLPLREAIERVSAASATPMSDRRSQLGAAAGASNHLQADLWLQPFSGAPGGHSAPSGRLWYTAPEIVLRASPKITTAADIWSLATVLAEMAAPGHPFIPASNPREYATILTTVFGGSSSDPTPSGSSGPYINSKGNDFAAIFPGATRVHELLREVGARKKPTPLESLIPNATGVVMYCLQRMLKLKPSDRISAAELLRDLESLDKSISRGVSGGISNGTQKGKVGSPSSGTTVRITSGGTGGDQSPAGGGSSPLMPHHQRSGGNAVGSSGTGLTGSPSSKMPGVAADGSGVGLLLSEDDVVIPDTWAIPFDMTDTQMDAELETLLRRAM